MELLSLSIEKLWDMYMDWYWTFADTCLYLDDSIQLGVERLVLEQDDELGISIRFLQRMQEPNPDTNRPRASSITIKGADNRILSFNDVKMVSITSYDGEHLMESTYYSAPDQWSLEEILKELDQINSTLSCVR